MIMVSIQGLHTGTAVAIGRETDDPVFDFLKVRKLRFD